MKPTYYNRKKVRTNLGYDIITWRRIDCDFFLWIEGQLHRTTAQINCGYGMLKPLKTTGKATFGQSHCACEYFKFNLPVPPKEPSKKLTVIHALMPSSLPAIISTALSPT